MIKSKLLKRMIPVIKYLIPLRLPHIIAIEASNRCFLNCITCPISKQMRRKKGDMSLQTFKCLLDKIEWRIDRLSWAFGGEPLLNRDIWQMIKLASERGIPSKIDTNGMLLNYFEHEIFNSGLKVLNIVFEGLSRESTSSFRKGYDYELVMNNIKMVSTKKNKIGAEYPIIGLNYLVRRDNEDEIEQTIEWARRWKLNWVTLKSINISPSSWLSEDNVQNLGHQFLPVKRTEFLRYELQRGRLVPKKNLSDFCRYLINSVTITWDGKILPCCFDFDACMLVGDIHMQDLKSIWRSKIFREVRKKIYNGSMPICNNCTSVSLQKKIILNP